MSQSMVILFSFIQQSIAWRTESINLVEMVNSTLKSRIKRIQIIPLRTTLLEQQRIIKLPNLGDLIEVFVSSSCLLEETVFKLSMDFIVNLANWT
jgi:hypothetical protein